MRQKSLIVNADDCNLTSQVTEAIVKAHENGIVTSTTFLVNLPVGPGSPPGTIVKLLFVEIGTDEGMAGVFGPIDLQQACLIESLIAPFLKGKDPLAIEALHDQMLRLHRHGRSGMFLTALSRKPADLRLTVDGLHMGLYGDAIMAIGVLRAFGVPDKTIAEVDTFPLLQCKGWNLPITRVAELLEVPAARFAKPELVHGYSF